MSDCFSWSRKSVIPALIGLFGLGLGQAEAATFYAAANVTATLNLGSSVPLSSVGIVSTTSVYDVNAAAGTSRPVAYPLSAIFQSVTRDLDGTSQSGGLAKQIFDSEQYGMNYPTAHKSNRQGTATATGSPSGSGLSFTMQSRVSGTANQKRGFANAGLTWTAKILLKNLTDESLTMTWTVNYLLDSAAGISDPKTEKAHAFAKIFLPYADSLEAVAPPSPPVISDPDAIARQGQIPYTLAPGATGGFEVQVELGGSATVAPIPLPATLWLFATALGALGMAAWRRKA